MNKKGIFRPTFFLRKRKELLESATRIFIIFSTKSDTVFRSLSHVARQQQRKWKWYYSSVFAFDCRANFGLLKRCHQSKLSFFILLFLLIIFSHRRHSSRVQGTNHGSHRHLPSHYWTHFGTFSLNEPATAGVSSRPFYPQTLYLFW